ncbi:MAG: septum formation protein Maf [Rhodospirillales bacterium]|nr:septum formation protein Maf [Rhodospirillales bacterium]
MNMRLILASASPRRLDLLSQIGITPHAVAVPEVDETPGARELPVDLAKRLAEAKAVTVAGQFPDDWVLAADTVVACGRRILGKPTDESQARAFLELLSGRRHRVHGGIFLLGPDGRRLRRLVTTAVMFKRLSDAEIDAYLKGGEWQGKAGAYAIQGTAAAFIPKIIGSYSNVVGLALAETAALLRGAGALSG